MAVQENMNTNTFQETYDWQGRRERGISGLKATPHISFPPRTPTTITRKYHFSTMLTPTVLPRRLKILHDGGFTECTVVKDRDGQRVFAREVLSASCTRGI
jgi:hypothetical protein